MGYSDGCYPIPYPCCLYLSQGLLSIPVWSKKPTDRPFAQNTKPYIKFADIIIYENTMTGK